MGKNNQLALPGFNYKKALSFGGKKLGRGNPREARPIATKLPMHLVLHSSLAQGNLSLWMKQRQIVECIYKQGKRFGVKLYDFANAGNHLHLIIQAQSRGAYHSFIRALSGLIPRIVLGVERGRSLEKLFPHMAKRARGFWDARPFSRVVERGGDFTSLKKYIVSNREDLLPLESLSLREKIKAIFRMQSQNTLVALGYEDLVPS